MPLCAHSVETYPNTHYKVGTGVQLWSWRPAASALDEPLDAVSLEHNNAMSGLDIKSQTSVIETSEDLSKVLDFSLKCTALTKIGKFTAETHYLRKHATQTKTATVFVGQAWRRTLPTLELREQPTLSQYAATVLSEQGEDAFQQQYGLFYVNRIYIGGYLQAIYNLEYSSEEELYEFKAEMKYGKHGFGAEMSRDEEHRHSAAHVRLEARGWDRNIPMPNRLADLWHEAARFPSHPGEQIWLDLAPYSSLPSYQAAFATRGSPMQSSQLVMGTCERLLRKLQGEYAALQRSAEMIASRRDIDSHATGQLHHVQNTVNGGQLWFEKHQTTQSLINILTGRKQPYFFKDQSVHAAASADVGKLCTDTVQGSCGGRGRAWFDDNHLVLPGQAITQISFKTGHVLDSVPISYGGERTVHHGGAGGVEHAPLYIAPEENIVGVRLMDGRMRHHTAVKDVVMVIHNWKTNQTRAWSAQRQAIDIDQTGSGVTAVPGKVLKCFTGRTGWYVDQLSCVWHTPEKELSVTDFVDRSLGAQILHS